MEQEVAQVLNQDEQVGWSERTALVGGGRGKRAGR